MALEIDPGDAARRSHRPGVRECGGLASPWAVRGESGLQTHPGAPWALRAKLLILLDQVGAPRPIRTGDLQIRSL